MPNEQVIILQFIGLSVTAFVRDPSKLPGNLQVGRVVKGDVLNPNEVDEAVKDQDAVIIALGTRNDLSESTVMSTGTKNILQSMQKFGVKRVSCCLSCESGVSHGASVNNNFYSLTAFLFWEEEKIPSRMLGVHNDHKRMYDALKASDREWIVMCPPHIDGNFVKYFAKSVRTVLSFLNLVDKPGSEPYKMLKEERVGPVISKHDLGDALVSCLFTDEYLRTRVGLGY